MNPPGTGERILTHVLRIGIIGTARIARSFTLAVRPSKRVTVAAVASRDLDKAQRFAQDL
jgi:xylose dehydrogenase (NAD/NADP)